MRFSPPMKRSLCVWPPILISRPSPTATDIESHCNKLDFNLTRLQTCSRAHVVRIGPPPDNRELKWSSNGKPIVLCRPRRSPLWHLSASPLFRFVLTLKSASINCPLTQERDITHDCEASFNFISVSYNSSRAVYQLTIRTWTSKKNQCILSLI